MEILLEKLNKIFLNCEEIYNNINTKQTRNSKIHFNNVLEYIMKYSKSNATKRDIMSTLKIKAHRSSYDRKLKNIDINFFKELFLQII